MTEKEEPWATADKYAGGFIISEYTGEAARYCGRSMDWSSQPIIDPSDVFASENAALAAWEIYRLGEAVEPFREVRKLRGKSS